MTPRPEHDYIGIGLSSASSSSSSDGSSAAVLKTELRLGLPGSESPERGPPALTLALTPRSASGSKRGFSDSSPKWVFGSEPKPKPKDEQLDDDNKLQPNNNPAPAAKVQVVGWPPIRNFRKNTMANTNADANLLNSKMMKKKKEEECEGKHGWGCLYVKVSMDGAPYLRKVDLKIYSNYKELSMALQKMFSCFTIDQSGSHGIPARDGQGESRLTDNESENVLTYEDKDGDWMLVGDVPWDMFTETCRRLRIMKGSDAIGLAPRATGKRKNQN